ncbi:MAG: glycosyltransferase family 2 protein [Acidobacteriia bacterium]|nr:glycosyltransferase family 2 protein [Terriglobia bacterium]
MASDLVSVLITTHNEAGVLPHCLKSLTNQEYPQLEVIIVDNASTDDTREILGRLERSHRVLYNPTNVGFAAAQNQAMRLARGQWMLSLNPDVILSPSFVAEAVAIAESDPCIGTVCGKLLRWIPARDPCFTRVIDSTGIYFLRNLRHLDRGGDETDNGQYDQPAYVFGSTGAAALYRRRMVEEVSLMGEFYDEDFFGYREDADVAWRAQLMGWRCIYTPRAIGWHVRRVTPARVRELPLWINLHSVNNRFLMRAP